MIDNTHSRCCDCFNSPYPFERQTPRLHVAGGGALRCHVVQQHRRRGHLDVHCRGVLPSIFIDFLCRIVSNNVEFVSKMRSNPAIFDTNSTIFDPKLNASESKAGACRICVKHCRICVEHCRICVEHCRICVEFGGIFDTNSTQFDTKSDRN